MTGPQLAGTQARPLATDQELQSQISSVIIITKLPTIISMPVWLRVPSVALGGPPALCRGARARVTTGQPRRPSLARRTILRLSPAPLVNKASLGKNAPRYRDMPSDRPWLVRSPLYIHNSHHPHRTRPWPRNQPTSSTRPRSRSAKTCTRALGPGSWVRGNLIEKKSYRSRPWIRIHDPRSQILGGGGGGRDRPRQGRRRAPDVVLRAQARQQRVARSTQGWPRSCDLVQHCFVD
jgi:hypothetical protein